MLKKEQEASFSGVDKGWLDLGASVSEDVALRSKAQWDGEKYLVRFMGENLAVDAKNKKIYSASNAAFKAGFNLQLCVLSYLNNAKDICLSGEWVSAKGLRGGDAFFAITHTIPAEPLIDLYGSKIGVFLEKITALGGEKIGLNENSAMLNVLPRIPVAFVWWPGDAEFGAELNILFDKTADEHLPLDALWAMSLETVKYLK